MTILNVISIFVAFVLVVGAVVAVFVLRRAVKDADFTEPPVSAADLAPEQIRAHEAGVYQADRAVQKRSQAAVSPEDPQQRSAAAASRPLA